jgi:hypothetical protein
VPAQWMGSTRSRIACPEALRLYSCSMEIRASLQTSNRARPYTWPRAPQYARPGRELTSLAARVSHDAFF